MKNTPFEARRYARPLDSMDHLIGQKLSALRARKNMTQHELSHALQLSPETIRLVEAGKAPLGALSLYEACQILEVSMMYFFQDGEESPKSRTKNHAKSAPKNNAGHSTEHRRAPVA